METKSVTPVSVRWMVRRDMEEVLAIEQQCFTHPWLEEDFMRCLRQRTCIGMVADYNGPQGEHVVGFMVYDLQPKTIELLNFAVAPSQQRRGVGGQLVVKLKQKVTPRRRRSIGVIVAEQSLPAQAFFSAMGFRAIQVLRDFYEVHDGDAYRFVWNRAFDLPPDIPRTLK